MVSFHFRVEDENDVHTRVGVFAGARPGSRGKCGTLTLRREEWDELREVLAGGGRARATPVAFTRLVECGGAWTNEPLGRTEPYVCVDCGAEWGQREAWDEREQEWRFSDEPFGSCPRCASNPPTG